MDGYTALRIRTEYIAHENTTQPECSSKIQSIKNQFVNFSCKIPQSNMNHSDLYGFMCYV